MVDIGKFWIEGVILENYPQFYEDHGADLDKNGKIEGAEVFGDLNGNGTAGDREDYKIYLGNNRLGLSANIPFFKWGEKLSVNNRIHQLIYLESDLYPNLIHSAYLFLADLVERVDKRIGNETLSPENESRIYYSEMLKAGISFMSQSNALFVQNIADRQLDCDTSSFTAMTIGDERGNILRPVVVPVPHIFLRGKRLNQTEFNIDVGELHLDNYYGVDTALTDQGFYLKALSDDQMEGLFLYNRSVSLYELGRYEEELDASDRAIAINPKYAEAHYNRGVALEKLGRYQEALDAYNRAIAINPKFADAHYNLALTLRKFTASANTGWQFGAGISVYGHNFATNGTFGLGKSFLGFLRLRGDLELEAMPLSNEYVLGVRPEASFAIANRLMLVTGGIAGGVLGENGLEPTFRIELGAKITLPFIESEFDIGAATSAEEWDPKLSMRFQKRF